MVNTTKYLILTPGKNANGGISNYYMSIREFLPANFEYLERGSRTWPKRGSRFNEFIRFINDFVIFYRKLKSDNISVVQTTTSFTVFSLIRDAIFIVISKMNGVKVVVFFRGWNIKISKVVDRYFVWLFRAFYFKCDAIIELSNENSERLKSWGYSKKIFLETTTVNDNLLKDLNEKFIRNKFRNKGKQTNILYLARIEKRKGIYEAIEAIGILQTKNPKVSFTIAGENLIGKNLMLELNKHNIHNYIIEGYVKGDKKVELLKKADLFIFPSYYEGMPNSVLEAMAFGLPVITRYVGGLQDFFINEENGFITKSKSPELFAEFLKTLIDNNDFAKKVALNNFYYSQERFKSSIVANRIINIFDSI